MSKIDERTVKQRIDAFVAACKAKGIKATHQRIEIMRELASTQEHPDADAVYRRVRERIPSIALDTVYRTLKLLEENGIISRVGWAKERARFDANRQRHHHFVCTQCGLMRDFYDEALDQLHPSPNVPEMASVETVYIELRGVCWSCRNRRQVE